jgi:hypothetical protein
VAPHPPRVGGASVNSATPGASASTRRIAVIEHPAPARMMRLAQPLDAPRQIRDDLLGLLRSEAVEIEDVRADNTASSTPRLPVRPARPPAPRRSTLSVPPQHRAARRQAGSRATPDVVVVSRSAVVPRRAACRPEAHRSGGLGPEGGPWEGRSSDAATVYRCCHASGDDASAGAVGPARPYYTVRRQYRSKQR